MDQRRTAVIQGRVAQARMVDHGDLLEAGKAVDAIPLPDSLHLAPAMPALIAKVGLRRLRGGDSAHESPWAPPSR